MFRVEKEFFFLLFLCFFSDPTLWLHFFIFTPDTLIKHSNKAREIMQKFIKMQLT
jgi:hypothetical protein